MVFGEGVIADTGVVKTDTGEAVEKLIISFKYEIVNSVIAVIVGDDIEANAEIMYGADVISDTDVNVLGVGDNVESMSVVTCAREIAKLVVDSTVLNDDAEEVTVFSDADVIVITGADVLGTKDDVNRVSVVIDESDISDVGTDLATERVIVVNGEGEKALNILDVIDIGVNSEDFVFDAGVEEIADTGLFANEKDE